MWDMPCVGRAMADYCVLCWFLLKLSFAVEAPRQVIVRGRTATMLGLYVLSLLSGVDAQLPAVQLGAMQITDSLLSALWLFVRCEGVPPHAGQIDSSY